MTETSISMCFPVQFINISKTHGKLKNNFNKREIFGTYSFFKITLLFI